MYRAQMTRGQLPRAGGVRAAIGFVGTRFGSTGTLGCFCGPRHGSMSQGAGKAVEVEEPNWGGPATTQCGDSPMASPGTGVCHVGWSSSQSW